IFFFSSRRRHTRWPRDWSSDVCSSDLSYGKRAGSISGLAGTWDSTGEVRLTKDVEQSLRGKNVILVEDILDTGLTLTFLKRLLKIGRASCRERVESLVGEVVCKRK